MTIFGVFDFVSTILTWSKQPNNFPDIFALSLWSIQVDMIEFLQIINHCSVLWLFLSHF